MRWGLKHALEAQQVNAMLFCHKTMR